VPSIEGKLLGDPLVFRASTLPNSTTTPVADFAFRRTERIHVEWPVLTPLDQRQARLLDSRGQPLPINASATELQSTGTTVLAADLALTTLAAGEYVVEVAAAAGGVTEQRLVAFRVVR
jgi:non-ribosomal peptide synthetase component F